MSEKNTVAFGIYSDRTGVERAVDALKTEGFRKTDISILLPLNMGSNDCAGLGGGLGWLAGIGTLAIPGLGPFIAAGPIMTALAGAGSGGAVGDVTGALAGMAVPENVAKRYEGRMKDGGVLLSIHCEDYSGAKKVKTVLERTGAEDISSTGDSQVDFGKSDWPMEKIR